jgi:hypothetical protein
MDRILVEIGKAVAVTAISKAVSELIKWIEE